LVEALVSTLLLATALVSLPHLFAIAAGAIRAAGDTTTATLLAAQKIEEFRSTSFPPSLSAQGMDFLDARGEPAEASGSFPVYTRVWWTVPLPSARSETIAIAVAVLPHRRIDGSSLEAAGPELARVVTLRARKAP
jgi:hypothetical protein